MAGELAASPSPPIVWRLRLAAPPERVFAAWLDPEQHARFWCELSERTALGFRQSFVDGTVGECALVAAVEPTRLELRYFGTRVEIELAARGGGTDLTLTCDEVPAHDFLDLHAGWLNVLLPLKAWLDFGVDLRNHDRARTWRERYVDQ
jgi:uncharacterized protein YndB with AHSA1/START domain